MNRRKFIKSGSLFVPALFLPKAIRAQSFGQTLAFKGAAVPKAAGGGGGGNAALVASIGKVGGLSGDTTDAINTSTANLIVVGLSYYTGATGITVSDNKSNTYNTSLTVRNSGGQSTAVFYYLFAPNVGSNHTFTVAGTLFAGDIFVQAFSGIAASPSS